MVALILKITRGIILAGAFLCLSVSVRAMEVVDTLVKYTYRQLDELIYENLDDSIKQSQYLSAYLDKAQVEANIQEQANYYKDYVFLQASENRVSYLDSAFHFAYLSEDHTLIGDTYLVKGLVYYSFKDYHQALDHYLLALDYIKQAEDEYNSFRVKNLIAGLKNYLGYYGDAEALFEECVSYFGQREDSYNMHRGYISSMLGLAWAYTKTGRIHESEALLDMALESAERMGFSALDGQYLVFKQGINAYLLGSYHQAIRLIEEKLPFIYENEDFAWASIGEFYIGKSLQALGEEAGAMTYYQKIADMFQQHAYTHPDLREAYELLIDYYRLQGDQDQEIYYSSQLIKADRIYHQDHQYLVNRIHKKYTTGELALSVRKLEAALYVEKNKAALIVGFSMVAIALSLLWIYLHRRRTKKTIQALIQKVKANEDQPFESNGALSKPKNKAVAAPQMKKEVVQQLLDKLSRFEAKERYLKPKQTLEKLADSFGTNSSYLSQVVNQYKGMSFTQYVNTLRIAHLVREMIQNSDSLLLKYSMDSLAKYGGFSSTSAFSKAFESYTKVKPSEFIKELVKKSA